MGGISTEWIILYLILFVLFWVICTIGNYIKLIDDKLAKLSKEPVVYELKMALDDIMTRIDETNLELSTLRDVLSPQKEQPPRSWDD